MSEIKAIETEYEGYRFRSRLEARWAVFFDACGVVWKYKPEGFCLGNGEKYYPDFLLYNVYGRNGTWLSSECNDVYVEVAGMMTEELARKIDSFYGDGAHPIFVVAEIPNGETIYDIFSSCDKLSHAHENDLRCFVPPYNLGTVDGDNWGGYFGINRDGQLEIFGELDMDDCDETATVNAYRRAREARFENCESSAVNEKEPDASEDEYAQYIPPDPFDGLGLIDKEQCLYGDTLDEVMQILTNDKENVFFIHAIHYWLLTLLSDWSECDTIQEKMFLAAYWDRCFWNSNEKDAFDWWDWRLYPQVEIEGSIARKNLIERIFCTNRQKPLLKLTAVYMSKECRMTEKELEN